MAKKLNKRLVGALTLVSMLLLLVGGWAFIKTLPKRDPKEYEAKAEAFRAQGKLQEAYRSYRQAYEFDPDRTQNPSGTDKHILNLVRAAEVLYEMGELIGATVEAKKAITANPDNEQARALFLKLSYEIAKLDGSYWNEVFDVTQRILPADEKALGKIEQEKPELAAKARQARAEYFFSLGEKDESTVNGDRAVVDLRRLVFPTPESKATPLQPTNVDAARMLMQYWLVLANRKEAKKEQGAAAKLRDDAAQVVKTFIAANATSDDPILLLKARMLRLPAVPVGKDIKLPDPLLAFPSGDAANADANKEKRAAIVAVLTEAESFVPRALAASQPGTAVGEAAEREARTAEALLVLADAWQRLEDKKADAQQRLDDKKKAEGLIRQAMPFQKDARTAVSQLGRLLRSDNRLDDEEKLHLDLLASPQTATGVREMFVKAARAAAYDQLIQIGIVRRAQAKDDAAREAAIKQVEEWVKKATGEFNPSDPFIHVFNARLMYERKEYIAATKELEEASKGDPKRLSGEMKYELHRTLLGLYDAQGQSGSALQESQMLIRLNPFILEPYIALATQQFKLELYNDVLRTVNALLQSDSPLPVAVRFNIRALRADTFRRLGQLEEAKRELGDANRELAEAGKKTAVYETAEGIARATIELDTKNYAEAVSILTGVLEADPANLRALNSMAIALKGLDHLEEFKTYVAKAREKKPDEPSLKIFEVYANYAKRDLKDPQRDEAFEQVLGEIADPYDRALQLYAFYRSRSSRADDAQKALDEAAKIKPDAAEIIELEFASTLSRAAGAKDGTADWAAPERWAERAKAYNNGRGLDEAQGKMFFGRLYLSKGECMPESNKKGREEKFNMAVALMTDALAAYPNNAVGLMFLGQAFIRLNHPSEARDKLEKALAIQPNNALAHKLLAKVYQILEDEPNFKEQVRLAYTLGMKDDDQINEIMQIIDEENDPEKGYRVRKQTYTKHPERAENVLKLARDCEKLKRDDEAREYYEKYLKLKPDEVTGNARFAEFLLAIDKPEDGLKVLTDLAGRLGAVSPKDSDDDKKKKLEAACRVTGGIARFQEEVAHRSGKKEDLSAADTAYRNAIEVCKSPEAQHIYGGFLVRCEKLKEGIAAYDRARKLAADLGQSDKELEISKDIIRATLLDRDLRAAQAIINDFRKRYPDDPDLLIIDGTVCMLRRDYLAARQVFADHLFKHPEDPIAYWQRGSLYLLEGTPTTLQLAVDDLRKAKQYSARLPSMRNTYEHRVQLARALKSIGQVNEAVNELRACFDEILKVRPGSSPDLYNIVSTFVEILTSAQPPRVDDAEKLVFEVASKVPTNPIWANMLGRLAQSRKDYTLAIDRFKGAARIARDDRDRKDAYRSVVRCLSESNQHAQIVRMLSEPEIAPLAKTDLMLTAWLAAARMKSGDREGGWADAMMALNMAGADSLAIRTVCNMFSTAIGAKDALERVEPDLKAHPDDMARLRLKIIALFELKRIDEGMAIAGKALEAAKSLPDKTVLRFLIASQQYIEKKYNEAAATYRQLLEADPNNAEAMNNLAFLLANELKKPDEAMPLTEKMIELRGDSPALLDTRGWVLALAGRYSEAEGMLFYCISRAPEFIDARKHLGMTYKMEGKNPKAAEDHLRVAQKMAVAAKDDASLAEINAALKEMGVSTADASGAQH